MQNFNLIDFIPDINSREYKMIDSEDLRGSELIDNLLYLRFMTAGAVRKVLAEKYGIQFTWLLRDTTPEQYEYIAQEYHVTIWADSEFVVYVPFNVAFDRAKFEIDVPNHKIVYKNISNLNYQLLRRNRNIDIISNDVIQVRPKLLLRRILLDMLKSGGVDLHVSSQYDERKMPVHKLRYRIKRRMVDSPFVLEWDVINTMIQTAVSKMSMVSAQDLDSGAGVSTTLTDIFLDQTSEVRFTSTRVSAGYNAVMSIQTTDTTLMTVDQLGFAPKDVERIRALARRRTGLTLVTGEMRSGKNTTIFAMLNEIVDQPLQIVSYENPIEIRMPFPQFDYSGDVERLKDSLKMAKKQDIDIAMLNEIPDAAVAFAVRDLVNSAIGVFTTTHIDRAWHIPYKLREFFGDDYKTIISQLNAVITQKMFRRWKCDRLQKRLLDRNDSDLHAFAAKYGVTQYFQPEEGAVVEYSLQPIIEIVEFDDSMKSAMENFDEIWRAEQMIRSKLMTGKSAIEHKIAEYVNLGIVSLEEMRDLL